MDTTTSKPKTVDEYIAIAPANAKEHLELLRYAVLEASPEALEGISYEMPAYKLNGVLVYFGGFAKHVSLFPGPGAIAAFKEELSEYKTSTGTIQFPLNKKIPTALVRKIVKFRVKENLDKAKAKKQKNNRKPS